MGERDDQGGPTSQVVIPYWSTDDGNTRPLPGTVVSYACPSIVVTSGPFNPGQPLTVQVTAANYGLGTFTSLVEIRVYWASASAGLSKLNPFGSAQTVPVPTHGGSGTTVPVTDTIPVSAGPHCCLFASAKFQKDAPGATADPFNDRHWAQLNLFAPAMAADGSFQLQFWAGNPLRERTRFELVARPAGEAALAALTRRLSLRGMAARRIELALHVLDVKQGVPAEGRPMIEVDLRPGERKAVSIEGRLLEELPNDQFAAVEVEQHIADERRTSGIVGSFGLVLVNPSRGCADEG